MDECHNLEKCNFFKMYQNDESKNLALKGFISMFCKGERQNWFLQICYQMVLPYPEQINPIGMRM